MNGLAKHTEQIFERLSKLDCVKDYLLMGGTALALQLHHRLSEDLDFCRWHTRKGEKLEIDWTDIVNQLNTIGQTQPTLIDKTQCDFLVEGVRVTFLADNKFKQPENLQKTVCLNNIQIVDKESIAVMKMEVMTRRTTYRDFYDMYAILNSGVSLQEILYRTGKYTFHNLRTRDMLSVLVNASEPKVDVDFVQKLQPIYNISFKEIKETLIQYAKEMV